MPDSPLLQNQNGDQNESDLISEQSKNFPVLAYEDELLKIYQGDSQYIDRVLEKSSVSLCVTSPPYPGVPQPTPDYVTFPEPKNFQESHSILEMIWKSCYNVLEDLGRLCINIYDIPTGPEGMYPNVAATISRCLKIGFVLRETIIWHKGASYSPPHGSWPYPKGLLTANTYEPILVFQKPLQFSQRRKDPSDYPEHIRKSSELGSVEHGWLMDPVWKISAERDRDHPFPFPLDIPSRLIKLYSYSGDTILDPFLGSGTTLRAAKSLGRHGVGVEISSPFIELAKRRLGQETLF